MYRITPSTDLIMTVPVYIQGMGVLNGMIDDTLVSNDGLTSGCRLPVTDDQCNPPDQHEHRQMLMNTDKHEQMWSDMDKCK